jgi:hypothetical protein
MVPRGAVGGASLLSVDLHADTIAAMGIRETLNENPRITTGMTVAIIVVVLAWLLWPRGGGAGGGPGGGLTDAGQLFYTTDDGKTWFADDANKIPPFKKDGKEAVRAEVYKCGGKTFVNHMVRYSPEGQKQLAAAQAKAGSGGSALLTPVGETEMEVKSPGDAQWVKIADSRAQQVMKPKCSGDGSDLEVVKP